MFKESILIRPTTKARRTARRGVFLLLLPLLFAVQIARSNQATVPASEQKTVPPPGAYAGEAVCAQCHAKQEKTYALTPHALDSTVATATSILGSFTEDQAVLRTGNPNLVFVMVASRDGFYQTAVNTSDPQHLSSERKRFDIVVGSGRHGQTYLYWDEDKLFELPVSYWTYTHRWVNSPGYPDGQLHWNRRAGPRCLECHVSYFTPQPPPLNRYVKDSLVLGIDCERCHGPGALHVQRERAANPPRRGSPEEAIVNPARLSRDNQIGLCTLCHAGPGTQLQPALTYKVGDDIKDFLKIPPPAMDAPVDVHGNQVGALEQSKCYTSGKLTCSTCHNVHETQENAQAYSPHCLECHKVSACGRFRSMGASIRGKCIDCHMPEGKSNAITTVLVGESIHATFRNHRIAVYKDATLDVPEAHRP
jgi:hypothetical protein